MLLRLLHSKARAFVCLRQPSYFLFAWPKRKITKEKGHPAWRLPPIHGRPVREPGPGFSTGHPALAKRSRHPGRLPRRGLSSPTHRRTGAPGRAAGHPGPHFSEEPKQSGSSALDATFPIQLPLSVLSPFVDPFRFKPRLPTTQTTHPCIVPDTFSVGAYGDHAVGRALARHSSERWNPVFSIRCRSTGSGRFMPFSYLRPLCSRRFCSVGATRRGPESRLARHRSGCARWRHGI
jgi:hypothetical protein